MRRLILALLVVVFLAPAVLATGADGLPPAARIQGVRGNPQAFRLSCESRSAADLAAFWGIAIAEVEFFNALPKTDNPDTGFVGDVNDSWGHLPPRGYGVHADPIASLLNVYGLPAVARHWMTMLELKNEIAAGRPVIIWATSRMKRETPQVWTAADGTTSTVAPWQHTFLVVGYTETDFTVIDPWNGRAATYLSENLETAWGLLGYQAVTVAASR